VNKPPPRRLADISADDEESEDEWVEVDSDDDLLDDAAKSLTDLNVDENADNDDMNEDDDDDDDDVVDLDPSCCFMCDKEHKTLESCMVHMHKHHGLFIPDVEYLKDPKGLLTYLGLKV
jgi:pre-60S factor REI1